MRNESKRERSTGAVRDPGRVLITGGAGLIGSALAWELNRRGCDRIVIADFLGESEKWRNLVPLRFEDYLEADDLFPRLEAGVLGKFDLVLHMGACSSTTERDAAYLVRNNYEFTKDLCDWALWNNARFAYASSAATYGDGEAGMSDRVQALADLEKLRPLNAYGYSKHLFDLHALRAGTLDRIVGLKFFNVFGPNEDHKGDMRSVVRKAYEQVLESGVIRLFRSYRPEYADGAQERDFLYVKDAVRMALHLALSEDATGLYNLGSGETHTWLDLAHGVFHAMDRAPEIEFIDMPESLRGRYQYHTRAELGRLREAGYTSTPTPLGDAIDDYVRNYLLDDRRLGSEPARSSSGSLPPAFSGDAV
jgi:ADP-L-glycero-D-manno-heptose 6-epimerase